MQIALAIFKGSPISRKFIFFQDDSFLCFLEDSARLGMMLIIHKTNNLCFFIQIFSQNIHYKNYNNQIENN